MRCAGRCGVLGQPFPKDLVKALFLGPGQSSGFINKMVISAERNIFHTKTVYTIFVRLTTNVAAAMGEAISRWRNQNGGTSCS